MNDIAAQAREEYLPTAGRELTDYLEWLVREERPVHALDVGAMTGNTTVAIARNLRPGCRVTGIEISAELARRAAANLHLAGLSDRASIVRADAHDAIGGLVEPVNLAFFDASRAQYGNWLNRLKSKLAPGAVIVANLTGAKAEMAKDYLRKVRASIGFSSESRTFAGETVEISRYH